MRVLGALLRCGRISHSALRLSGALDVALITQSGVGVLKQTKDNKHHVIICLDALLQANLIQSDDYIKCKGQWSLSGLRRMLCCFANRLKNVSNII